MVEIRLKGPSTRPGMLERLETRIRRMLRAKRATHSAYTHFLFMTPDFATETLVDTTRLAPETCRRISEYYHFAHSADKMRAASMWDAKELNTQDLLKPIIADDATATAQVFQRLFIDAALDGMSHGNSLFSNERRNPYERGFLQRRTLDCLLSLAEAVGTQSLPSYSQKRVEFHARHMMADHGETLIRTEKAVGFDLTMPSIGSPDVIRLGNRPVAPDSLRHAYVAWRARQLVEPTVPIVEIGGGYGMLALLANRAGFEDWTIIDLPFVGCIQLGYLAGALGPESVATSDESVSAPITISKPEDISDIRDNSVGLVVNCDSLPEIGRETALAYLREIKRISPLFLSINQEAGTAYDGVPQGHVGEMVEEVGGFRRVYRFRHWMEQGYAEELYERV